jgi:hypothetical protein
MTSDELHEIYWHFGFDGVDCLRAVGQRWLLGSRRFEKHPSWQSHGIFESIVL